MSMQDELNKYVEVRAMLSKAISDVRAKIQEIDNGVFCEHIQAYFTVHRAGDQIDDSLFMNLDIHLITSSNVRFKI